MHKSRFSKEQIIAILKDSEAGGNRGAVAAARHHASELLPLEIKVQRHGGE